MQGFRVSRKMSGLTSGKPVDQNQQTTKHRWLWELHTGLLTMWTLSHCPLPPDSGTSISKWNEEMYFYLKRNGTIKQQSSSFPPLSMMLICSFLMVILVQEGFNVRGMRHLLSMSGEVTAPYCSVSCISSFLMMLQQILEGILLDNLLKAAVLPISATLSTFSQFSVDSIEYSTDLSVTFFWTFD